MLNPEVSLSICDLSFY